MGDLTLSLHPWEPQSCHLLNGSSAHSIGWQWCSQRGVRMYLEPSLCSVNPRLPSSLSASSSHSVFLSFASRLPPGILPLKPISHHMFSLCAACGILVPQPEIEPVPPAVKAQCPNTWTTKKALLFFDPLNRTFPKGKGLKSKRREG